MLICAPFKNSVYWKNSKLPLMDVFINKIEKVIPGFSQDLLFKEAATPDTLYRWTVNYNGASYGWEATPSQFAASDFSQNTAIKNLYLTGHWTTLALGLPGVAYLGRSTAKALLIKHKRQKAKI